MAAQIESLTMLSTEIAYFGTILPLAGLEEQLHPPTRAHSAQSTSNDSARPGKNSTAYKGGVSWSVYEFAQCQLMGGDAEFGEQN